MFDHQRFSKIFKILKLDYLDGKSTDYQLIQSFLNQLEKVELAHLKSDHQKLVFWLNTYNGLTNYAIIHFEIKSNMKEVSDLFKKRFVQIGGMPFSLDDIEHGLLRRNGRKHLPVDDPRLAFQVDILDYRIHFALNCGAQSCPAIAFYDESYIEQQLQEAEKSFFDLEFILDKENKTISCSALFEWYKSDFGDLFLNDPKYADFDIHLRPYDWSV